MQRVLPELKSNARKLRHEATPAERVLWHALRDYRPRFTRQLVVGHFILDLACRSLKIGIELDGGHHATQASADDARTAYLSTQGWILRFWNSDVMGNLEGVITAILAAVAQASTHPQPLPSREGRSSAAPKADIIQA